MRTKHAGKLGRAASDIKTEEPDANSTLLQENPARPSQPASSWVILEQ
ncbi:hypothetical protein WJ0W_003109 [Paenibacillus melissococcoides]|uniref:Uncharacterized protein n=1 Tax=Paenibacillus melissococcoides TaxID=2912268 RepID=A0ABM9G2W9_9BACL|nr:hypothetical protein WJ0W_003109 [Paenibacillus melissococcoides]